MSTTLSVSVGEPHPRVEQGERHRHQQHAVAAGHHGRQDEPGAAIKESPQTTTVAGLRRRESDTAVKLAAADRTSPGTSARPARTGLRPSTSCRYWVSAKWEEAMAKTSIRLVPTAALNRRTAKIRTSIIGSGRCSRRRKTAPSTGPAAIASPAGADQPCSARSSGGAGDGSEGAWA